MLNKTRLSVLDLIILIAATGLGLALARLLPDYLVVKDDVMVCDQLTKVGPWRESTSGMGWTRT